MLLDIILSTSGAKARKSWNRCSWTSFCRLLEPRPNSLQIDAPGPLHWRLPKKVMKYFENYDKWPTRVRRSDCFMYIKQRFCENHYFCNFSRKWKHVVLTTPNSRNQAQQQKGRFAPSWFCRDETLDFIRNSCFNHTRCYQSNSRTTTIILIKKQ